jgi:hypothetical protein
MSWIRTDDDTYIDETLVMCAEYQLFLDEMRSQGKYHQPDHWIDYSFPKGHAIKPILGMRPSDAVAFCKWLTQNNNDGWTYRLPIQQETREYVVQKAYPPPVGNWTSQEQGGENFAWVGAKPQNPRGRNLASHIEGARSSSRASDLPIVVSRILNNQVVDLVRASNLDQARAIARELDGARTRVLDFANTRKLDRANVLDISNTLTRASKRLDDLAKDLEIARASARVQVISIVYELGLTVERELEHARTIVTDLGIYRNLDIDLTINLCLNLYIDIFTLRERIENRSPAFEGIRLVKERIK